jgi:bifunctional non-homologous end joining protein LigD
MTLKEYRKKRDFRTTPEPPGRQAKDGVAPLSFVVHKHLASRLHYDLRLEIDGVLKSWAVPKGFSLDPADRKLAVMVEDHPLDYGAFEGVIPEGSYGAGPVMIWDRGRLRAAAPGSDDRASSEEALRSGLAKGHISFILEGERLKGEFALVRLRKAGENAWLLIKANDDYARHPGEITEDTSVVSGRTIEEIAQEGAEGGPVDLAGAPKAAVPAFIEPMKATLIDAPFDRQGWLFEIKWDGYRAIATIGVQHPLHGQSRDPLRGCPGLPARQSAKEGRNSVRLYSRNDKTMNEQFKPIVDELARLPFEGVLDGEVVALDKSGRADFQLLQNYLRSGKGSLVYYVFDILHYNGHDLMDLPLARRKAILRRVLPARPHIKLSEHVETDGTGLFAAARQNGVEGIVAKDAKSPYRPGSRGREWLKVKALLRQEAVIGGFTRPRGRRAGFGSLVLGAYEDGGRLAYIGHSGGGFSEGQLEELHARLKDLSVKEPPFAGKPPASDMPVTWVEPAIVCEIKFSGWTDEGLMRQPVFLGLREDIDPADVRREIPAHGPDVPAAVEALHEPEKTQPKSRGTAKLAAQQAEGDGRVGGASNPAGRKERGALVAINDVKVDLTHLDKVFWPDEGYTKGDMIDYYRGVAPFILPYLAGRPESLRRNPDGIAGMSFFQKNVDGKVPDWVETVKVRSETDGSETVFLVCRDEATLVYMANLGCIEINPWHSRVGSLDRPDYIVFDLDPLDIDFAEVVRVARETEDVLAMIGARGCCKTSGATGLHVYVPLGGRYSHKQAVEFARLVNLLVQRRLPETTSLEREPARRHGKVYLDFLQNGRGQTLAAAYCLRPGKGAPVSTPLEWSEVVPSLDHMRFTMQTIMPRLKKKGDLWKDVLGPGIDMEACLGKIEAMGKK